MIWDVTVEGKCINDYAQDVATGALNIFSDLAILVLPLPMLWKLQLHMKHRLSLIAIFMLGSL